MKNSLLYKIESKVIICVKGNNIERFIHRLVNNNIELLEIKQIKYNEVNIAIYEHDYKKVLKLKTTYEISLIGEKGLIKIKHFLLKNIYLIISFLICLIILRILTNLIFQIDIIHNDKEIRNIISRELTSAGIKKYTLNKKYNEIQDIKQNILNKYKDKIEWLEIEKVGVKYVVRVQERSIIDRTKEDGKHNIVSKKSAIIKKINATSGTIVKSINDYVVEGDVIISGEIKLNDEIKNYDMLVLPGGRPGGQNLLENQDVISLVQYFNEHHQYIAAMCSGTVVLEKANVIKGKKVTGYTGYQDKLVSGDFVNEVAVFDQNIVTSQGPATPYPFAFKILEVFGKDVTEMKERLMYNFAGGR